MLELQTNFNPGSRAHFYRRYLRVDGFTRRAPFAE